MADVTCALTREDRAAFFAEPTLPSELRALLEDREHVIELAHGYEMELTEAQANALLAYAQERQMQRLASTLKQELDGLLRRKREGGR